MSKLFMYDQYRVNPKSAITPTKMSLLVPDVASIQNDFLSWGGADEPTTVMVADNTVARVGTNLFDISGASVGLANLDSGDAFEAGAPYYLYVCDPGNGSEDVETDEKLIVSLDSSYPVGWAAGNTRQIGGFKVGSSGDIILESSLWTLLTRRYASGSVLADITEALLLAGTEGNGAGLHNSIYRGKYHGDAVTAEQWEAIRLGTFDGLWIGDYWTINGVNWRVHHFDYWYRSGDTECLTHHIAIMPDTTLYTGAINSSRVTTGGYAGSKMHESGLTQAKTLFANAFGSEHILKIRRQYVNAMNNGLPSGQAFYDSTVDLPTENMITGSQTMADSLSSSTGLSMALHTEAYTQFQGMALNPQLRVPRTADGSKINMWTCNPITTGSWVSITGNGSQSRNYSDDTAVGVRPVSAICG